MSFLSSGLFWFLIPLLTLPVVIHLLNKGFPKLFEFPSIDLIKETLARRSKIHQWRHLILLLLRTLFLMLLLFAFMQPVLDRFGKNVVGDRNVLIMFDHSASMEHRGDGPSSREKAVHEAKKLIESLGPNDVLNIVLIQPSPSTAFVTFSRDHAEMKRFVEGLKPGLGRGDVNLSNVIAGRLLKTVTQPEIYFISDFQRKNWANVNFTSLPESAKLFFVDVGPLRRENIGILKAELLQSEILAGDMIAMDITVGNFRDDSFNGRLSVVVDKRYSFDQEISIVPWSETKVTVPISAGTPGLHLCEVRLPSDSLEYDNNFFLTLNVQEKEEVLIVSDDEIDQKSSAYFLKMALNPFENEGGSLLPKIIPSSELSSVRLAGVKKMFFTQVNRFSTEMSESIAKFLLDGGGLIYFLDGPADPENLATLESQTGPNTMPIRLSHRHKASNVGSGAQQIVYGDFKSPYMKLFQGTTRQDLSLLEFYDYYQAGKTSADGIVLVYGDQSPAMASVHHGLGAMLLLNFSAAEVSSNLARQRIFPAWMQELLKAVSVEESEPSSYNVAEKLQAEVWRNELAGDSIRNPSGNAVTVNRQLEGDRYIVTFTPDQIGFYTLGSPDPSYAYGVNLNSDEIDLRSVDKELLPAEFASTRQAHVVRGEDYQELAKGTQIYHWFIYAGLLFLILESGFQFFLRKRAA